MCVTDLQPTGLVFRRLKLTELKKDWFCLVTVSHSSHFIALIVQLSHLVISSILYANHTKLLSIDGNIMARSPGEIL